MRYCSLACRCITRHKLSVTAGQTAYADDWGEEDPPPDDPSPNDPPPNDPPPNDPPPYTPPSDPTDRNGDVYTPIYGGTLPQDGAIPQFLNTCVPTTLSDIGTFYGISIDPLNVAYDYYQYEIGKGINITYNDVVSQGVGKNDIDALAQNYFTTSDITNDDVSLDDELGQNAPVLGVGDFGNGGRAVMIVSYDVDGNVEYFDPNTGYYASTPSSTFTKLIAITGLKTP